MSGKSLFFDDTKINKSALNKNKELIQIDSVDVNKILVSQKETYGKKGSFEYAIGDDDNDDIRPLCIKLLQMIWYAKYFDTNKIMSFRASD